MPGLNSMTNNDNDNYHRRLGRRIWKYEYTKVSTFLRSRDFDSEFLAVYA